MSFLIGWSDYFGLATINHRLLRKKLQRACHELTCGVITTQISVLVHQSSMEFIIIALDHFRNDLQQACVNTNLPP